MAVVQRQARNWALLGTAARLAYQYPDEARAVGDYVGGMARRAGNYVRGAMQRRRSYQAKRRSTVPMRNMGRPGYTAMANVNRRKGRKRKANKRWKRFVKRVNTAIKKEPKFTNWKETNNDMKNNRWHCMSLYATRVVNYPIPVKAATAGSIQINTGPQFYEGQEYQCTGYDLVLRILPTQSGNVDLLSNTRLDMLILSKKQIAGGGAALEDGTDVATSEFKQDQLSSFDGNRFFSDLDTGTYQQGYYCHKREVLRAPNKNLTSGDISGINVGLEYRYFFKHNQKQKYDGQLASARAFENPKFDELVLMVRPQVNGVADGDALQLKTRLATRMRFKDW